jgi:squalene-hopene/tetraprenyl-beta-curcumene cyclase
MILDRQHSDGGWSLREFGSADAWADGIRRARLESEPEFYLPQSDGHMTGLAVIALVESGVASRDQSIQLARRWIEKNQRASGRWWTSSLNTENLHLITYSGTCFCLLALSRTGGLLHPEP